MRTPTIAFIMTLFLPIYLSAQDTHLTLTQACDYAITHNKTVANSTLDVAIAKKKILETMAIGFPQISARVEYQDMLDIPTQLLPDFISPAIIAVNENIYGLEKINELPDIKPQEVQFGTQHNLNASITATQLLFSGSYLVGLQASRVYRQLSEYALEKNEQEIISAVSNSYFAVVVAQATKITLDTLLANTQQSAIEMEAMLKEGLIESTDVDQIRLNVINISNSVRMATRQIDMADMALKFQMGFPLDSILILTDNIESLTLLDNVSPLLTQPFEPENTTDYKLAQTQEALMLLDLKNKRSEYYPTLSAFATHQQSAMRNEFDLFEPNKSWFPVTIIGITLDIPVLSSGQRLAKNQQAKLALHKAQNNKLMARDAASLELNQARTLYANARERLKEQITGRTFSKKIYENTRIKYQEGLSSSLSLTQTQSQFLMAENNYYIAAMELLNAQIRLKKIYNNIK